MNSVTFLTAITIAIIIFVLVIVVGAFFNTTIYRIHELVRIARENRLKIAAEKFCRFCGNPLVRDRRGGCSSCGAK